jgi:hypothetical protein
MPKGLRAEIIKTAVECIQITRFKFIKTVQRAALASQMLGDSNLLTYTLSGLGATIRT